MTGTSIKDALISLGYKLFDRGDYWQTTAVYRNGDNPTALQIYKDSGVWRDYVAGNNFMPFKALLEKSIGTNNKLELQKYLNQIDLKSESSDSNNPENSVTKVEKTFSKEDVENLLPHYTFYHKKGVSTETLQFLKSGMCTGGSIYQLSLIHI